jgi:hypothetical protein
MSFFAYFECVLHGKIVQIKKKVDCAFGDKLGHELALDSL